MVDPGVITVVVISSVMFIVSFSAGIVPLAMSLNQERMNLISSFGVGLLVGTSLGVVLPEGIEMLYASMPSSVHHRPLRTSEYTDDSYHLAIALALVLGYLVMHLLTFLPPLLLHRNVQPPIPLSSLPSSPHLERVPPGPSVVNPPTGLSNTTIGLCIHALADGIALGSSAIGNNMALEGIVFFAIMLHKASPFNRQGLTSRHQHRSLSLQYFFANHTFVIL
jgi:solute carrier family 39 (zinc transporter), member 9